MEITKDNQLIERKLQINTILPYIFSFFIFSFLGWVMETIFCYGLEGHWVERGFLYSPICPIYGTGALILMIYLDNRKSPNNNHFKLFILFTIIFSFFEYLVGFTLDALFASRWWDYSDNSHNLNGRITLLNSFFWGIITILFVRFLYPLTQKFKEKVLYKIPTTLQIVFSCILICSISVDFILSCIHYLS